MGRLRHQRDLKLQVETMWLVEGLIPRRGLTVVWGKPGSGKTFWVLDIAAHVANGLMYRDLSVEAGAVVYFTFEAGDTFVARVFAARESINGCSVDAPLWVCTQRFSFSKKPTLYQASDGATGTRYVHDEIIAEIHEIANGTPVVMVVLDTLNKSIDGTENSDEDMRHYMQAAEGIGDAFECAVVIVHHCGTAGDRPRGHTSLTGTAACQIMIDKDDNRTKPCIKAKIEKMKDGSDEVVLYSWMTKVIVGTNNRGRPIESCYLDPAPPPSAAVSWGLNPRDEKALAILVELAGEEGRASLDDWRRACVEQGLGGKGRKLDSQRKSYDRARDNLIAMRRVVIDRTYACVVRPGDGSKSERLDEMS